MDKAFWLERWAQREIGFNERSVNRLLDTHWSDLALAHGGRVFLPLCGKTIAISWLLAQGYRVAGIELSEVAVRELFAELGVTPAIQQAGALTHYAADGLDIYVGDFFALSAETLGPVDALYDRAALVALPADMRKRYTAHLTQLSNRAPQLLITFDYDQQLRAGPPFAIDPREVEAHYADAYNIERVAQVALPQGLRGGVAATENAWLLRPKA